ncbi:MAG: outer membrane protein OmpK [Gammaproteobacteria bacterium]|nr:outer membrane protein OmpK [Gammaproteobacteria bacterium]
MRKLFLAVHLLAITAFSYTVAAADYLGDIHKNDYRWMQFNLMYALDELPQFNEADDHPGHDYFELEFGGRSGIVDLYGYIDVFDLTESETSDKKDDPKTFIKLSPRFSLDGITGKDLSFGALKEIYFATLYTGSGGSSDVNNSFWGFGSDLMVPWFGKVGVNLYGLYDVNEKAWNGYQLSTNWFKRFFTLSNGSYVAYQGYVDYQFGMRAKYSSADHGGQMFNGLYWHSDRYAVGYGLKLYKNVYGIEDQGTIQSTGFSHYFSVTYKL